MNGLISHENALNFIFGGKSEFTMINVSTGNQFSYKILKSPNNERVFFVRVKKQKNTKKGISSTYIYAGYLLVLNDNSIIFKQGDKGNINSHEQCIESLCYVINRLKSDSLNPCVSIYHVGKCAHCGRKLTDANSISMGFGKECAKKLGIKIPKNNSPRRKPINIEQQMQISI